MNFQKPVALLLCLSFFPVSPVVAEGTDVTEVEEADLDTFPIIAEPFSLGRGIRPDSRDDQTIKLFCMSGNPNRELCTELQFFLVTPAETRKLGEPIKIKTISQKETAKLFELFREQIKSAKSARQVKHEQLMAKAIGNPVAPLNWSYYGPLIATGLIGVGAAIQYGRALYHPDQFKIKLFGKKYKVKPSDSKAANILAVATVALALPAVFSAAFLTPRVIKEMKYKSKRRLREKLLKQDADGKAEFYSLSDNISRKDVKRIHNAFFDSKDVNWDQSPKIVRDGLFYNFLKLFQD
jgi:hypothetical protein